MRISNQVDVVVAEGEPGTTPAIPAPAPEPDGVDVAPDPHRRIIVLAPTKDIGYSEARAVGIEPVAVVTPRTLHAARGIVADAMWDAPGLTVEEREALGPHVLPSLVTTRGE